jgi:hypothetical protein
MQNKEDVLVPIGKASKILEVSIQTLRRWDKEGKLVALKSTGGQRRYRRSELKQLSLSKIFQIAHLWATEKNATPLPNTFYCPTRAVFESRLQRFGGLLETSKNVKDSFPLIVAAAGEIGNNSFDHNLGNWPDEPGLFFGYDIPMGIVVLADRGQGILTTLQRVRPTLYLHTDALSVAFTEVLTGRAPEKRGNGLKFVKKVIQKGAASITFQTGNAKLTMSSGSDRFSIEGTQDHVRGTLAYLEFKADNK